MNIFKNISKFFNQISNDRYSKYINDEIISKHKEIIGKENLKILLDRFNSPNFMFNDILWNQVLTTRSTAFFGTGIGNSSVSVVYRLIDSENKIFSVNNKGLGENFEPKGVKGTTNARSKDVPTCRIVSFESLGFDGDYWILYVSEDYLTILVASPLFIPETSILVSPNFGCYILTHKTHSQFWNDSNGVQEIRDVAKNFGYDNFFNKPLASAESLRLIYTNS